MPSGESLRKSLVPLADIWNVSATYPYVTEFAVAYNLATAAIERSDYRGLLFVQPLVKDSQAPARLLVYWRDAEAFKHNKDRLGKRLAELSNMLGSILPTWEGTYQNTLVEAMPGWFELTFRWASRLSAIAALVLWLATGLFWLIDHALEVSEKSRKLQEAYGSPAFEIISTDQSKKIMVGRELDLPVEVRNISPYVRVDIQVTKQSVTNESGREVDGIKLYPISGGRFSALDPNKKETFRVLGMTEVPGRYNVKLQAAGKAGDLKERSTGDQFFEFPIQVWSDFGTGDKQVRIHGPKSCSARVELLIGKRFKNGLRLTAKLEREPTVIFDGTSLSQTPAYKEVLDKEQEVRRMIWYYKDELGPMETVSALVFLRTTQDNEIHDKSRWQDVVNKISISHHDLSQPE